ncbi:hypothetical protein C8R41DRAFT_923339 [Lentinula lateritia]|uniref:Uncharacterized protein n=1 Tax=Lentinula lateritia TaxID=40482 RepID=A0ABQ8V6G3_9AGAR|nr:hypothetical protein C8R41DRAFT_923339 [Lentinula lateritia]
MTIRPNLTCCHTRFRLYETSRDHEANRLSSSRTSNRIFPTGSSLQSLVPKIPASTPTTGPMSPHYNYENRSPVSKRHRQTEPDDIMINSKGSVDYLGLPAGSLISENPIQSKMSLHCINLRSMSPRGLPSSLSSERESALVVEDSTLDVGQGIVPTALLDGLNPRSSSSCIFVLLPSASTPKSVPSPVQSKPSPLVVNGDGMPPNLKAIVFYKKRAYKWNGIIPNLIHNMIESGIKANAAVQAYHVEVFFAHFDQPPKFKDHNFGISVRYYVDTARQKDFPGHKYGTFTFIPKWEDNQPTLENQSLDSTWQYIEHLYTATKPSNSTKKSFNPAAQSFDPSKQPVAPYDLKLEWH